MGSETAAAVPKIDLTGLDPANPAGDRWDTARAEVMQALESHGCLVAVYGDVTPELREELFGRAAVELFSLPLASKQQSTSDLPYQSYIGQVPGWAYESIGVSDVMSFDGMEGFTRLMWPEGNAGFRDTILLFAKHLKNLELMIEIMVLQSLGIRKYYDSHTKSIDYVIRLAEYEVNGNQELISGMAAHIDPNFITIICQHLVGGLEVQTRDGSWMNVAPFQNSFAVMIGEAFKAWTNGRLLPPYHRVRLTSNEKRYSVLFGSRPKDGYLLQSPKELVDDEHPQLYKPYKYDDYLRFRFSEEGARAENAMTVFCGVGDEVEE